MLAEVLVQIQNANQDIGTVAILRAYADRRIKGSCALCYFTDSLVERHLFQRLGILDGMVVLTPAFKVLRISLQLATKK